MIDSHCHLDCCSDIDNIVKNFDGIIITSGYDDKSNLKVLELVDKYPNVYGTLGIHPEEASTSYDLDIIINGLNLFISPGNACLVMFCIMACKMASSILFF